MRESQITRLVDARMRTAGAVVLAIVGGPRQPAGLPDRYVAHPLYVGWIEYKSEDGRLSPLQQKVTRDLLKRGARVLLARVDEETMKLQDPRDGATLYVTRWRSDDLMSALAVAAATLEMGP